MIRTGLCSVTFRELDPVTLIDLAAKAGVAVIEWGGDRHLPPGEVSLARDIRAACAAQSVDPCSYGSYVRAGTPGARDNFATVLATAEALGARNIRVWAGNANRADAGDGAFRAAADDLAHMARAAADRAITVSVEYHRNTLTEDASDALALLIAARSGNLFTYWQPVPGRGLDRWRAELDLLSPFLGDLHVFHWIMTDAGQERRMLAEGIADWRDLFDHWLSSERWPHPKSAFLEFVRDDDVANFQQDIRHLRRLCDDFSG